MEMLIKRKVVSFTDVKVGFRAKTITQDKQDHFLLKKKSRGYNSKFYAYNRASKLMKQKLL